MAEELKKQYQEILNRLENLQTDSSDRDAKYLQIASLLDEDFNTKRKKYLRENKLNELKEYRENIKNYLIEKAQLLEKREKEIEIAGEFYTSGVDNLKEQKDKLDNESNKFDKYKDFSQQKYKVRKFDNFINNETIHLLYILFIILIISSLCILLGLFKYLQPGYSILLVTSFAILYILYMVKIVYIDRVNINKYVFRKYDFNKPSEQELAKGKKEETEFKEFKEEDKCNENTTTAYGPVSTEIGGRNTELENKVKSDIGEDKDSESKCFAGPYDPT